MRDPVPTIGMNFRVVVISLAIVGCGAVESPCGPDTCAGCCSASGVCLEQPGVTACGTGGNVCRSCGVDQRCQAGTCRSSVLVVDAGPDAGVHETRDAGIDAGVSIRPDAGVDAGAPEDGGTSIDAGVVCPRSTLTPPNLIPNAEFECLGGPLFTAGSGTGLVEPGVGRGGSGLRFTVGPGLFGNQFSSAWRVRLDRRGMYCLRAFVRGTATVISTRLYVGAQGTATGQMFDQPGPLPSWQRIPPTLPALSFEAQRDDEVFLTFVDPTQTAGATIEVDDLDLFLSEDGTCRDR